ncbi:hypothetical protein ABW20_dc0101631 [Dactylellina cionopaga]|nr:hypothetical protein ABW20_dc0101631 [Dactylellina cionopaga]
MASNDSKPSETTTSGIQTLASGTRVIPSSVRADGSTRPERRVKPGFTPAEDIAKYQNRTAEAWRNRGSGGVPGATEAVEKSGAAKKKRSRKKKGTGAGAGDDEKEDDGEEGPATEDAPAAAAATTKPVGTEPNTEKTATATATATADAEKKAKGLQKKIRQAQELKARKEKGETLLPEQLDKTLRLGELIRDLEKLGVKYEE